MTIQNLWDSVKAVQRRFIDVQGYLKKQENDHINNLNLHLKKLEKEVKKPRVWRNKEIVKISAEINKKEIKQSIVKISNYSLRS